MSYYLGMSYYILELDMTVITYLESESIFLNKLGNGALVAKDQMFMR